MGVVRSYGPGNSQSTKSNHPVNRREFKIVGKETHSGRTTESNRIVNYIKFHFDENDKLDYADGRYNHIYFVDRSPFNRYQVGDILKIDVDKVRRESFRKNFNDTSVAKIEY